MSAADKRTLYRDCGFIALASCLPVLILRPFQNIPFVDDWAYAWSVENLMGTGRLQVLDFSSNINLTHVLWGTLFCLPFGFSFAALRVSTWVLSVLCLCGLYLTLRELGVPRRESLAGTATLGVYPVYFLLSFTFMTDVPFLSAVVWSVLCLIKAVNRESDGWLVVGAVLACAAVSIRLVGIVLPAVFLATLVFHCGSWGRSWKRLLIAIVPGAFGLAMVLLYPSLVAHRADMTAVSSSPIVRRQNLALGLMFVPELYVMHLGLIAGTVGLAMLPLTVGIWKTVAARRALRIAAMLSLLLGAQAAAGSAILHPLKEDFFWSLHELGVSMRLVPHYNLTVPPDWIWIVHIGGALSLAVALTAATTSGSGTAVKALGWHAGGSFLLMTVLWLLYDRYILLLLPALIALTLSNRKLRWFPATVVLIATFAGFSFVGSRNHLAYSRAIWEAVETADRNGIAPRDLDGGYTINGWLHYAHPEQARLNAEGNVMVPGLTSQEPTRYQISNSPRDGASVVATIPYQRWLGRSGSVYLIEWPDVPLNR